MGVQLTTREKIKRVWVTVPVKFTLWHLCTPERKELASERWTTKRLELHGETVAHVEEAIRQGLTTWDEALVYAIRTDMDEYFADLYERFPEYEGE